MRNEKVLTFLMLVLLVFQAGAAQRAGRVKGVVYDADTEEELAYAQVQIVGTTLGAVTDLNGRFDIAKIQPGKYKIQARYIGYRSQTKEVDITVNDIVNIDFTLQMTAITMDEVVVTGTAIETERKALGNTIATVSMAEIGEMPTANISEVLKGRAAGVVAIPSSGQAGSGSALRVRGMTSVSMSNEPIVYIDGVRLDNYNYPDLVTKIYDDTGGQEPSRLNDIAPSDIERVEVIKGAAASTLYGTEASNGVIQIFTKRGTKGAPRIHFQHQRGWIRIPDFEVGQMKVTQSLIDSLGRKYDNNPDYPDVSIDDFPNLKVGADPVNSIIRTSPYESYEISLRGGSDLAQYYVSGRYENEIGSIPSNQYRRYNFRANVDADVTDKLKLEIRTGYMNSFLRRPHSDNSIYGMMGNAFLANLWSARPAMPWGEVFTSVEDAQASPTDQRVHRFTGGVTAKYRPYNTWNNKMTMGIDVVSTENTQLFPWQGGFPNYPIGYKSNHRRTATRITLDYTSSYTQQLSDQFMGQMLAGFQGFFDSDYQVSADGEEFPAPGVTTVDAAAITEGFERRQKVVNAGSFMQAQLGWRERMYLTAGVRGDGSSAFGEDFNVEYYPKVALSYIITEEDFWPLGFWNGLKLRTAYGTAGKQPGAYDAQRTWSPISALAGVPAVSPNNLGQPNLKPEKSHELELGFDANFLNDRYGVEFTYYDQVTREALLQRLYPPSQGFINTQLDNVGEVKNKGFETLIRAIPIRNKDFEAIFNLSFAKNENKVTDLGGTAELSFGLGGLGEVNEGYPISSFWGRKTIGVEYDSTGGYGRAIISDDKMFVGQALPKWNGSFSINLTLFSNFRIYALADWATGQRVYNSTKKFMALFGTYQPLLDIEEKLDDPNLPVAERIRLQEEYNYLDPAWDANYVEDADWLKIREIAVTYTLPKSIRQKYLAGHSASFTLSMRNVAVFSEYSGTDPEVNYRGQSNLTRGMDFFTVPGARRIVFTVNVDM